MSERLKVLIVDDDKTWQAFLSVALQDNYSVKAVGSGDLGIECALQWSPDAILLDIEMPIKNGYETCAALKANPKTRDVPVIFLSSKASLQEKISGFQLGADDYLVKPCETEILNAKVSRCTALYREKIDLDLKATGAQVLAFEAMNSSADLGRSLRYTERTYSMHTFDKLAEGLFQTMAEFGLDTAVMFITETGPRFYAQNKHELSPLEKDMFLAIHQEGRFCDFGCRTFCNFKLVSLLIKNMPEADPERYGRIKDTVPWILGATDGKVGALDVHNTLVAQHQHMSESIQLLRSKLSEIMEGLSASEEQLAVSSLCLRNKVIADGLPQTDRVDAEEHYQHIQEQLAQHSHLTTGLLSAISLLKDLSVEQERVAKIVQSEVTNNLTKELGADEIFSSDVDLF